MDKKISIKENSIKYVKFTANTGNFSEIKIKATLKELGEHQIVVVSEYEDEPVFIATPCDITLDVICYDGLYKANTKLISVYSDNYISNWIINMPEFFNFKQERAFFRISNNFECDYIIEIDDEIKNIKTHTIDISANGVSIFLPVKLLPQGNAELNLYINEKKIPIVIDLVRYEEISDGFKLSFKYKDINPKDIDYISTACIKRQIEERRNMAL